MSKKNEPKLVKQYFSKRPPGSGYHANLVQEVPEALAKEYQKAGYCRDVTQTLPTDLPGRDAFMDAGIETIEEIEALEDPTEINGIGDATAEDLAKFLSS